MIFFQLQANVGALSTFKVGWAELCCSIGQVTFFQLRVFFNLQWVYQDVIHCKLRKVLQYEKRQFMHQVGCKPLSLVPRPTLKVSVYDEMPLHHLHAVAFVPASLYIDPLNIFGLCYYQEVTEISSVVYFIITLNINITFFRNLAYALFYWAFVTTSILHYFRI